MRDGIDLAPRGNAFLAFAIAVCLIGLRCGGGRLWCVFCER
jgi:hypothetical protein